MVHFSSKIPHLKFFNLYSSHLLEMTNWANVVWHTTSILNMLYKLKIQYFTMKKLWNTL